MTTAIITFSAVLLVGLSILSFFEWRDDKRRKKRDGSYPKCGKVKKELDRLLDFDEASIYN